VIEISWSRIKERSRYGNFLSRIKERNV